MNRAYIILAAGKQARWNAPVNNVKEKVPEIKQLVLIKGKPLIRHIQDNFPGAIVVTNTPEIEKRSSTVYHPAYSRWITETLYYTVSLWKQRTVILLGDVFYGKNTIRMIKDYEGDLTFFINKTDILAISFNNITYFKFSEAVKEIVKLADNNVIRGKLWHVYRYLNGINLEEHRLKDLYTKVIDNSRDFDIPLQYVRFCRK